ncbi:hypothetical protein TSOC_010215, partial [Tetrabaena socialis]
NEHGALPVSYGAKKSYSFVQLVVLLPPPATWAFSAPRHGLPTATTSPGAAAGTAARTSRRPFSARGGHGASSPERLARSQAATVRLELEVQQMEERLQLARSVLGSAA